MTGFYSWKKASGNILALISGTALARVLSAVIMVLIARQIGPEAYGQYSGSIALLGLSTVAFSLGLDAWLLYSGGREPDQLRIRFTSALAVRAALGMIWLAIWCLVAPHLNQSSFPRILVSLAAVCLWLEQLATTVGSAFTARLRNDITAALMLVSQGIFLAGTLWLTVGHVQEPAAYVGSRIAAAILGALAAGVLAFRIIGYSLDKRAVSSAVRGSLPFAVSIAFSTIYGRADLAIVASELGKSAAGVYAPALTLTNALFLIPAAVFGVMVPMLSKAFVVSPTLIGPTTLRLTAAMVLLGLVVGVGLAVASEPLIRLLYGQSFGASGGILTILSAVLTLRFPTIAIAAALVAVGWQTHRTGIQGVAAASNVALNYLVVHKAGVSGVARVYVLTEFVLLLGHLGVFLIWLQKQKGARQESS